MQTFGIYIIGDEILSGKHHQVTMDSRFRGNDESWDKNIRN